MKVKLDMSGLRHSLTTVLNKVASGAVIDMALLDGAVIDHLQEQFDVEGMTEDGATGTFTRNSPAYDIWKRMVYGEDRRMHKTHQLRDNVGSAKMVKRREGDEIVLEWSWDAYNSSGFNYADYYQNDPEEEGRRLVLTEPFLEELMDDLSQEIAEAIEEMF